MATSTPKGNPVITYDYRQTLKGETVNQAFHNIIETGVYEDLNLTKVDDVTVRVSTGTIFIGDSSKNVAIKSRNTTYVDVTVSNVNFYVIARFNWVNTDENYPDYLGVSAGSILSDDIILGRCVYSGTVLSSTFDLTLRKEAKFLKLKEEHNYFSVTASEPYSNSINISSGTAIVNGVKVSYAGGSVVLTDTINGRNDAITIDDTGTINVTEGADSVTPVDPSFPFKELPIAIIRRGASATNVKGTEIDNYSNYLFKEGLFDVYSISEIDSLLLDSVQPIGSVYIQYPDEDDPATLFGGTWSNISSNYAGNFFRAEGGNASTFESGSQSDAIRNITGYFTVFNGAVITATGAFSKSDGTSVPASTKTTSGNYHIINFSATSAGVPTAVENRPLNRTVRVWKRTA